VTISVLVLTLNEEANLAACLSALSSSDDIVVLDSFSTDQTTELAKRLGARVIQRKFDSFAGQRNYALDTVNFKYDWILHIDADEVVTAALQREMFEAIQSERLDAYRIPSKTMFFVRWLRFSGMYPTYQVRLGRKGRFRFKQVGHGQREDIAPDRVGTLKEPYLHYSFSKGLAEWFEKHNRYSTDEAQEAVRQLSGSGGLDWAGLLSSDPTRRRRAVKQLSIRLPFRPALRFLYMYVFRLGFLDGRAGLAYCRLLAIYEYMIVMKMREIRSGQRARLPDDR
jgi:glycosyltransferase involved in cell wall biosynthesis